MSEKLPQSQESIINNKDNKVDKGLTFEKFLKVEEEINTKKNAEEWYRDLITHRVDENLNDEEPYNSFTGKKNGIMNMAQTEQDKKQVEDALAYGKDFEEWSSRDRTHDNMIFDNDKYLNIEGAEDVEGRLDQLKNMASDLAYLRSHIKDVHDERNLDLILKNIDDLKLKFIKTLNDFESEGIDHDTIEKIRKESYPLPKETIENEQEPEDLDARNVEGQKLTNILKAYKETKEVAEADSSVDKEILSTEVDQKREQSGDDKETALSASEASSPKPETTAEADDKGKSENSGTNNDFVSLLKKIKRENPGIYPENSSVDQDKTDSSAKVEETSDSIKNGESVFDEEHYIRNGNTKFVEELRGSKKNSSVDKGVDKQHSEEEKNNEKTKPKNETVPFTKIYYDSSRAKEYNNAKEYHLGLHQDEKTKDFYKNDPSFIKEKQNIWEKTKERAADLYRNVGIWTYIKLLNRHKPEIEQRKDESNEAFEKRARRKRAIPTIGLLALAMAGGYLIGREQDEITANISKFFSNGTGGVDSLTNNLHNNISEIASSVGLGTGAESVVGHSISVQHGEGLYSVMSRLGITDPTTQANLLKKISPALLKTGAVYTRPGGSIDDGSLLGISQPGELSSDVIKLILEG